MFYLCNKTQVRISLDCRNAGYFNSLIRTPGLRLKRSVDDFSFKEDKGFHENILSNITAGSQSDKEEDDIKTVARENQRAAQEAHKYYGFISRNPNVDSGDSNALLSELSEPIGDTLAQLEGVQPQRAVSAFNRGLGGPITR